MQEPGAVDASKDPSGPFGIPPSPWTVILPLPPPKTGQQRGTDTGRAEERRPQLCWVPRSPISPPRSGHVSLTHLLQGEEQHCTARTWVRARRGSRPGPRPCAGGANRGAGDPRIASDRWSLVHRRRGIHLRSRKRGSADHSFLQLLSKYSVSGSVLGAGDTAGTRHKALLPGSRQTTNNPAPSCRWLEPDYWGISTRREIDLKQFHFSRHCLGCAGRRLRSRGKGQLPANIWPDSEPSTPASLESSLSGQCPLKLQFLRFSLDAKLFSPPCAPVELQKLCGGGRVGGGLPSPSVLHCWVGREKGGPAPDVPGPGSPKTTVPFR